MTSEMTRDERHRWLFAHMKGYEIKFTQQGMPFRVMRPNAEFGGVVYIGDCRCRIRIVRNQEAGKGKRNEVRFPDTELEVKVPLEDTTVVGYMEVYGDWKQGMGRCEFIPVLQEK